MSSHANERAPRSGASPEVVAKVLATADRVADELRTTAAARDRTNKTPREEVELLRKNDLLHVQEPVEHGGQGLNYAQASLVTRSIARGDTSIAHLLGYHFAQTRIASLFGTPEQARALWRLNGQKKLFWGGVQKLTRTCWIGAAW